MKKRICAYLDDESLTVIEKYQEKYKCSVANLLRKA
ncbi:unnamed protein product, partial [marine sediment metagenome]